MMLLLSLSSQSNRDLGAGCRVAIVVMLPMAGLDTRRVVQLWLVRSPWLVPELRASLWDAANLRPTHAETALDAYVTHAVQ
jgi:hypothetical protein